MHILGLSKCELYANADYRNFLFFFCLMARLVLLCQNR